MAEVDLLMQLPPWAISFESPRPSSRLLSLNDDGARAARHHPASLAGSQGRTEVGAADLLSSPHFPDGND